MLIYAFPILQSPCRRQGVRFTGVLTRRQCSYPGSNRDTVDEIMHGSEYPLLSACSLFQVYN